VTKTNAKRGMVQYKEGYGKDALDWDYISNLPYNDKQVVLRDVIEGLRADDKRLTLAVDILITKTDELKKLESKIEQLEIKIAEVETKYFEALKGVISR
jgi:hypothetical protein